MASIHDLITISRDPGFQDRIRFAVVGIARNIMAEDGATTGHSSRVTFSKAVFVGAIDLLDITIIVLNESGVNGTANVTDTANAHFGIDDSVLPTTIFGLWNALSGVTN